MLLIVFAWLVAGSTQLSTIANFPATVLRRIGEGEWYRLRSSWWRSPRTRIPVDNLTTHLELTMVHEAMVLE